MKFRNLKKILAAMLCVMMMFSLAACSADEMMETLFDIVDDGGDDTVEPEDYSRATVGGETIVRPEDFPEPEVANSITGMLVEETDTYIGTIYLSSYRSAPYLFITGNSLTLNANFYLTDANGVGVDTDEDYMDVRVALWEKGEEEAKYIETAHFLADGTNQTYTFNNLKQNGEYRIAITYSSWWAYRVNGDFSLSPISETGSEEETAAEA